MRVRGDELAPEVQAGDAVQVREQDRAVEGVLAVVTVPGCDEALVRRYDPTAHDRVAGVVTWVFRRLP